MVGEMKSAANAEMQPDERLKSLKGITTVVYALQAAAIINGFTFVAAVIVNYIKRDDVRGTWLASHFRWQIRTFWFSLAWGLVGVVTYLAGIGVTILLVDTVWVIYRIAKGWLRLHDNQEMYGGSS